MVGTILSAIPAAVQAGTGIYQLMQASKIKDQRPEYSIPQEMLDMMTDSQIQSMVGMPAEQRNQLIQDIFRSQQGILNQATDLKSGLKGLGTAHQTTNDALLDVGVADADMRRDAQLKLQQDRQTMAGYQDQKWQTNEMDPFFAAMQQKEGFHGSGLQNFMGGIKSGSQMGLDYLKYMNALNSFGNARDTSGGFTTIDVAGAQDVNKTYNQGIYNAYTKKPKMNLNF